MYTRAWALTGSCVSWVYSGTSSTFLKRPHNWPVPSVPPSLPKKDQDWYEDAAHQWKWQVCPARGHQCCHQILIVLKNKSSRFVLGTQRDDGSLQSERHKLLCPLSKSDLHCWAALHWPEEQSVTWSRLSKSLSGTFSLDDKEDEGYNA